MQRFLLFILIWLNVALGVVAVDSTTVKQAIGTDVVRATLRRIEDTCIFPQDFLFMRRVAWQESKDGTYKLSSNWANSIGQGGIWQVDQVGLDEVKNKNTAAMQSKKNSLLNQLQVDVNNLNRANGDLEIPINDGAVARLLVSNFAAPIPIDLTAQANYWKQYYNTAAGAGTVADFLNNMQTMPKCDSSIDLMFILDSSGSIGSGVFENVRNFVTTVVANLTLSEERNRVGIIEFSDNVIVVSPFSTNKTAIINAANQMPYLGSGTATTQALDKAADVFSRTGRDPTSGYPWVAVLITDGAPDNSVTALNAATNLKSMGVTLFVVGVGNENFTNLQTTASKPTCVYFYSLDNYNSLASAFPEILSTRNCEVAALAPTNSSIITSNVEKDQTRVIKFPVNITTGMTWKLSMASGSANIYASLTSTSPSSADYDYKAQSTTGKFGQIYISPSDLRKIYNGTSFERLSFRSDYESIDEESKNQTVFIYTAIQGVGDTNNFTLKFNSGDTLENNGISSIFLLNHWMLCVGVVLCYFI
uniref:VWFA domain-containing protein n=1 Tax=Acrobeloides nanus TaxID=290746 RepID=A0A914E3R1_9BILA